MTDEERTPEPLTALDRLPKGAIVIFRHYGTVGRDALAAGLRRRARQRGLLFFVAGDWRLARRLRADGLHLPAWMTARPGRFAPVAHRRLLSAAAHGPASARRAEAAGAHLILVSPVFATDSHPGRPPLGVLAFAAIARQVDAGVLALGGVTKAKWRRLRMTGALGYAGIGGVLGRR